MILHVVPQDEAMKALNRAVFPSFGRKGKHFARTRTRYLGGADAGGGFSGL